MLEYDVSLVSIYKEWIKVHLVRPSGGPTLEHRTAGCLGKKILYIKFKNFMILLPLKKMFDHPKIC